MKSSFYMLETEIVRAQEYKPSLNAAHRSVPEFRQSCVIGEHGETRAVDVVVEHSDSKHQCRCLNLVRAIIALSAQGPSGRSASERPRRVIDNLNLVTLRVPLTEGCSKAL